MCIGINYCWYPATGTFRSVTETPCELRASIQSKHIYETAPAEMRGSAGRFWHRRCGFTDYESWYGATVERGEAKSDEEYHPVATSHTENRANTGKVGQSAGHSLQATRGFRKHWSDPTNNRRLFAIVGARNQISQCTTLWNLPPSKKFETQLTRI